MFVHVHYCAEQAVARFDVDAAREEQAIKAAIRASEKLAKEKVGPATLLLPGGAVSCGADWAVLGSKREFGCTCRQTHAVCWNLQERQQQLNGANGHPAEEEDVPDIVVELPVFVDDSIGPSRCACHHRAFTRVLVGPPSVPQPRAHPNCLVI